MIWLARLALTLAALATAAANGWALSQHPFAAPMKERTAAEVRVALDRALAGEVDAAWLEPRLAAAVEAGDADEAEVLLRLAGMRGLDPEGAEPARALVEARTGWRGCGACALNPAACATMRQLAACSLPVELTPVGDVNALRRAGAAWMAEDEIDRIDVALALVGLTATGAIIVSGPGGAMAKAGATLMRVARKAGRVGLALERSLGAAAKGAVRWDRLGDLARGRRGVDEVVDGARLAVLSGAASDVARMAKAAGPGEAIALVRHADDPADLARLARVTEAAGDGTRPAIRALGPARVLRTLSRVGEMALLAIGLLTLLAAQAVSLLLWLLRRALRQPRGARPGPRRRSASRTMSTGGA